MVELRKKTGEGGGRGRRGACDLGSAFLSWLDFDVGGRLPLFRQAVAGAGAGALCSGRDTKTTINTSLTQGACPLPGYLRTHNSCCRITCVSAGGSFVLDSMLR